MLPLQLTDEGSVCPLQLTAGEGLLRPSIKNELLYLKQKPNTRSWVSSPYTFVLLSRTAAEQLMGFAVVMSVP